MWCLHIWIGRSAWFCCACSLPCIPWYTRDSRKWWGIDPRLRFPALSLTSRVPYWPVVPGHRLPLGFVLLLGGPPCATCCKTVVALGGVSCYQLLLWGFPHRPTQSPVQWPWERQWPFQSGLASLAHRGLCRLLLQPLWGHALLLCTAPSVRKGQTPEVRHIWSNLPNVFSNSG